MKKIRLLFAISLFSTSIFSQWNNNGDNSTTGTLKISSLSSNSSNVNTIEIRSHASNESYQGINFNFNNLLKSYIISQITPQNGRVDLKFRTMNSAGIASQMIYTGDGDLGIGTTPKSKLDVNGTIRSKEVKIEATGWSDFVFDKDYMLPTLSEVESHINEHKHLSDIPSEKEVIENGINVVEMQAKLLQKIEELTLYVIEQNKQIAAQDERIKQLEKYSEVL